MVLSSLGAYVSPYGQSFATLVVLNVFGLPNKKKLKGVSAEEKKGLGRQASEPGGKDGGWTISHSLVGTQSWKFLVEIGGKKKKLSSNH